jgi:hypothetical protein
MRQAIFLMALLLPGLAAAQQSPSHKLQEHTFNSGGHPQGGSSLGSASFRLTLGAIGQGISGIGPSSASFGIDAGFVSTYPPPREVGGVLFTDATTLVWDAERSVGAYNLYQGSVTAPFDPGYGTCQIEGIQSLTTTVPAMPSPGDALFILMTAENRLREEGTKGPDSAGSERDNPSPCP